ncbi:MAG: sugar transferase [Chitinophagaceae bacterium]|nr:sugar transferase [Chitinophagaceae bacterium]
MVSHQLKSIACVGFSEQTFDTLQTQLGTTFNFYAFDTYLDFYTAAAKKQKFNAILSEGALSGPLGIQLKRSLDKAGFGDIPFSLILEELEQLSVKSIMNEGVSEVFIKPFSTERVGRKLQYLIDKPRALTTKQNKKIHEYHLPIGKRIFDIVLSSIGLLLLSPLFLIVAILLRLESKGPIFYYSLRVGTGYQIFRFYKFRSMFVGADKKLSQLKHLNQYNTAAKDVVEETRQQCEACERANISCSSPLYADNNLWCEKLYKESQTAEAGQTFVKIKNDPRVTRVGKFIRNASIDELPQLWNVLKGDMSLVGNRPLPLYEAEKLTTDKYALRFIAPAGITGLWQVSKRGKGEMSEDERISLDNDYAKSFGLMFDIRLILKTIPALFQKENV